MKTSTASSSSNLWRQRALAACVCATVAMIARADAADRFEISVSPPIDQPEPGGEPLAPIENIKVTASVRFDASVLATKAGIAQLKKQVHEAARKACLAAGPGLDADGSNCVNIAVRGAEPQIEALIARAKQTTSASK